MNISEVRIISSETMIAANVIPLARKHHAVPIAPTSTAASAGPKMREPVITAVFKRGRVRDLDRVDQFGHEGPSSRVVERVHEAEHERQHEDHGNVDRSGQIEQAQHDRLNGEG